VFRYIKCNGPHKTEHHRERAWYYKENTNINPPRLATKEGELCPHSFKYINCKKATIKWTAIHILIGVTVSIKFGIVKNNKNSKELKYGNVEILLSLG